MHKLCTFALCLLMTPVAALAVPVQWAPAEWRDEFNFNTKIENKKPISYIRNIIDRRERIRLGNQLGFLGNNTRSFGAEDIDAGWSIAGLVLLNLKGTLDVTVESLRGDFILESSKLWPHSYGRNDSASVPEPGSLALLGLGLVGLGLARRRLNSKR